jgi:hypothetical protein
MGVTNKILGDVLYNDTIKGIKCCMCYKPANYHVKVRKKDDWGCVWDDIMWFCLDHKPEGCDKK